MELYSIFTTVWNAFVLFGSKITKNFLIMALVVGGAIWLGLFILNGFGVYKMAKKNNLKRKWLAFVPIVNLMYMGKIAGEFHIFGQKMKRGGLYTMLVQILTTLLCVGLILSQCYLYFVEGTPAYDAEIGENVWNNLTGVSLQMYKFYQVCYMVFYFVELVYQILLILLLYGLYRKYAPRNYFILVAVCFLVPPARYIITFVLSGRKQIDYEAYMRARREAYIRQQQQYYGNYGAPYNRPYGGSPYANPYNHPHGQQQPKEPEDPFAEFGDGKKTQGGEAKPHDKNDPDEFFD